MEFEICEAQSLLMLFFYVIFVKIINTNQVIFRCFGDFDEISRRHQYFLFQCNIIPLKLYEKSAFDEKKKRFWSNQEQPRLNLVSRPLSRFTGRLAPSELSNDQYLIKSAFIWCKGNRQTRGRIFYGQAALKGGGGSSTSAITVSTCGQPLQSAWP